MSHGKMSDFVSFALFGFAWVIKQIFLYVLRFFYMISDLNMSCQTVSDLVYDLEFEETFGNKIRNTDLNFIEIV